MIWLRVAVRAETGEAVTKKKKSPASTSRNIQVLTGLRGIAAIFVLFHHVLRTLGFPAIILHLGGVSLDVSFLGAGLDGGGYPVCALSGLCCFCIPLT